MAGVRVVINRFSGSNGERQFPRTGRTRAG